ncbi:restriction endonuclease subunit S [Anaerobiospirillum succiniciproducens]|uniref:restriction endonuclease subunit S n=1 Tax=Anaerobiospirillum succiniciproducens TaxID=13335 RepID=UPI0003FE1FC4|nr:restriction endonuclease subunit S [Anaerobiospirillum succiniciproducens]
MTNPNIFKKQACAVISGIFSRNNNSIESTGNFNTHPLGSLVEEIKLLNKNKACDLVITNSAEYGIVPQKDFFDRNIAQEVHVDKYTIVENGDFVYNPRISKNAPAGPINRSHLNQGIVSPLYTVFRVNSDLVIGDYLECYFASGHWVAYAKSVANYGARHDRMNITNDDFFNMPIPVPDLEEQQKIAEFFTALDEKIRIAENQLELLESAYKALMAQVFLKNNNESIWQTIKLKDICKRVTRKNTDNRCDIPLTISSADGLVNQLSYFSKKIASKDMSKYYLLKRGEFAYNKSYSSGYDFGSIKRLKLFDEGALSTLYICFSIDCVNNEYMEYYFDSLSWYKNISKLCGEGARNHGLLNIGTSDFFDMELTIHKSPVDQEKIVNLFSCFSKKVSTLKQRVLLYKQLKKAFMQRMFV